MCVRRELMVKYRCDEQVEQLMTWMRIGDRGFDRQRMIGRGSVGLDLDVLNANASVRLFVLNGLLVALSPLLLENLLQRTFGVLRNHRRDPHRA